MQGKVNSYAKGKAKNARKALCLDKRCESWSGQIARTAILKYSKKTALKFLGKHA